MQLPPAMGAQLAASLGARYPPSPPIVFIIADDLGFNDVSFHGSPQIPTPAIDAIAKTGIAFDNYHAQPVCSPTRASILSGRHVIHTGIYMPFLQGTALRLNLSYSLLPQHLATLGYATHAVGKWHLGQNELAALPTGRGFSSYFGYWSGAEDYYTHQARGSPDPPCAHPYATARGSYDFADGTRTCREANGRYSTHLFAARASEIIASHNYSQPLFLYLAFQAVHWPLQAPAEAERRFDNSTGGSGGRRAVAGMAAVLDEGVANVSATLRAVGQWEKTLLVFTSDNGGPTNGAEGTFSNNYPMRGGKNTLWEGGTRVVAAVRGAGVDPKAVGSVSFAYVHATDWMPSLLRYASGREDWQALAAELTERRRRGEVAGREGKGGGGRGEGGLEGKGEGWRGEGGGAGRGDDGRGGAVSSGGRVGWGGLDGWLPAWASAGWGAVPATGRAAGAQPSISGGVRDGFGDAAEAVWRGRVGALGGGVEDGWALGLARDAREGHTPESLSLQPGPLFPDAESPIPEPGPLFLDAARRLSEPEPPFLDGDGEDVLASILTGAHVRKEILLEAHPPPVPWHTYVRNATAASPRGFTHHPGFLLEPGSDLKPAAVVRGIDGCAQPCLADARCTAFSFSAGRASPDGDILCHWKQGEVELVPEDHEHAHGNGLLMGEWKYLHLGPVRVAVEAGWNPPPGQDPRSTPYTLRGCSPDLQPPDLDPDECVSSPCLFHIASDPCEYRNLARNHPLVLARMAARLAKLGVAAVPPAAPDGCAPVVVDGAWRPCDAPGTGSVQLTNPLHEPVYQTGWF